MHYARTKKNNRAFTIIELIIYIALVGTVVAGIVLYSLSITQTRAKSYVVQEVNANGRFALDIISQRIRAANAVNSGSSTFDVDPGVLSLSMTDGDINPTVIDLTADDGRLRITEGVAAAVNLTSDEVIVTNLVFTNLTGGNRENIRIQLTIEYDNNSGSSEYEFSRSWQTTVSLRQ